MLLTFFGLLLSFYEGQPVQAEELWRPIGALAVMIPTGAVLIAYVAFLPSAAFFAVGEFFGWRSWLIYSAVGGLASLVAAGILLPRDFVSLISDFGLPAGRPATASPVYPLALLIGGGMCGGLAYWAVSGRRTPDWRERRKKGDGISPTSPAPSES